MSELKLQQCRLDGRYDIIECLGRGSYAELYVAHDRSATGGQAREVVIKALNLRLQGVLDAELERTLIEYFRTEALALDRVRHPNIINRLGHGTALDLAGATFHYLVLEYLPGGDLQALCRHHPLPLERALFFLEQVCAGLAHAHDCGVIHRDIKPQNLLLTRDHKTVKIADFGVAKIEAFDGAITRVGTEVYAAPEHHPLMQTGALGLQLASPRPSMHLTPAADVYSLAKTAYMLLTGEAPRQFSQRSITELPPHAADKPWAKFVLSVLRRATQLDPNERHQTVREFWAELQDALLPGTRLLNENGAGNGRHPASSSEVMRGISEASQNVTHPPPPMPAMFPAGAQPAQQSHTDLKERPRIVIPIADPKQSDEPLIVKSGQAEKLNRAAGAAVDVSPPAENPHGALKLAGATRRWLVAIILIAAFAGMLFALHAYVRRTSNSRSAPTAPASPVGREFLTTTDVNLRPEASTANQPVGLAEFGSRVRVLSVRGNWYEVEVLQHGRPKRDPLSSDRGWLNNNFLEAKKD